MNINDYKDVNGNVEVSETLVSDLIDEVNNYEEGTWTPRIAGSVVEGNNGYYLQSGTYTRIGNLVHIEAQIILTSKDANMSGDFSIKGVPFMPKVLSTLTVGRTQFLTFPSGSHLSMELNPNGVIYVNESRSGVTSYPISVSGVNVGSGGQGFLFYFSGSYIMKAE